ncbi:hypothetical protein ACCO45_008486 [Purpureocillium lilacinum]|uniref:Uncharacterized protein n=1 Tax=Purpureocillium lilacinum TaxID=33203 RepID=A0ACC4DRJ5_PURLI
MALLRCIRAESRLRLWGRTMVATGGGAGHIQQVNHAVLPLAPYLHLYEDKHLLVVGSDGRGVRSDWVVVKASEIGEVRGCHEAFPRLQRRTQPASALRANDRGPRGGHPSSGGCFVGPKATQRDARVADGGMQISTSTANRDATRWERAEIDAFSTTLTNDTHCPAHHGTDDSQTRPPTPPVQAVQGGQPSKHARHTRSSA